MGSGPRSWARVLIALVPPSVTAVTLSWFLTSGSWGLVGIWVEPSVIGWSTGFADLAYVTATADCLANGSALETCDPYGRPFTPYSIVPGGVLALLGIGLRDTGILGVALAMLWLILIGAVSTWVALRWARGTGGLVAASLAIIVTGIAPPSLLGVERGTVDIAITAAAGAGLMLLAGHSAIPKNVAGIARQFLASLLLFIAVIVKYFAVGVYAAFLAPRRWMLLPLISGIAATVFLVLNFGDLLIAREVSKSDQPSTTRIMFSSTTVLVTLLTEDPAAFFPPEGASMPIGLLRVLGVLLVLAWVTLFIAVLRRAHRHSMPPTATWFLVVGGGFILVIPYFLGDSNDYRLMGLVLPLAGILRWLAIGGSSALWLPVALIVTAMITGSAMVPNTLGFLMPKFLLILGDLALSGALGFCIAVWVMSWIPRRARVGLD